MATFSPAALRGFAHAICSFRLATVHLRASLYIHMYVVQRQRLGRKRQHSMQQSKLKNIVKSCPNCCRALGVFLSIRYTNSEPYLSRSSLSSSLQP